MKVLLFTCHQYEFGASAIINKLVKNPSSVTPVVTRLDEDFYSLLILQGKLAQIKKLEQRTEGNKGRGASIKEWTRQPAKRGFNSIDSVKIEDPPVGDLNVNYG